MPILGFFIEALEGWGLTRISSWLSSIFKSTPQKDEDKVHEVEVKVSSMSQSAIDDQLRTKWTRD